MFENIIIIVTDNDVTLERDITGENIIYIYNNTKLEGTGTEKHYDAADIRLTKNNGARQIMNLKLGLQQVPINSMVVVIRTDQYIDLRKLLSSEIYRSNYLYFSRVKADYTEINEFFYVSSKWKFIELINKLETSNFGNDQNIHRSLWKCFALEEALRQKGRIYNYLLFCGRYPLDNSPVISFEARKVIESHYKILPIELHDSLHWRGVKLSDRYLSLIKSANSTQKVERINLGTYLFSLAGMCTNLSKEKVTEMQLKYKKAPLIILIMMNIHSRFFTRLSNKLARIW